jgi:hypothetical protein
MLKEEHKNKALRRTLELRKDGETKDCRKMYNKEVRNFCSSLNTVTVSESVRTRRACSVQTARNRTYKLD